MKFHVHIFPGDNCDEMELTNPMNGMVTYTNNVIGSIATYSCITGYRLVGDSTRECAVVSSSQNSWSGAPPRCISKFEHVRACTMLNKCHIKYPLTKLSS